MSNINKEDIITKESSPNTVKIVIFVVVLVGILIIIYYLFCFYSGSDDDFLGSGDNGNVTVGWNIEDMVEKIHNRQRVNLSRLSKDAHYNI